MELSAVTTRMVWPRPLMPLVGTASFLGGLIGGTVGVSWLRW